MAKAPDNYFVLGKLQELEEVKYTSVGNLHQADIILNSQKITVLGKGDSLVYKTTKEILNILAGVKNSVWTDSDYPVVMGNEKSRIYVNPFGKVVCIIYLPSEDLYEQIVTGFRLRYLSKRFNVYPKGEFNWVTLAKIYHVFSEKTRGLIPMLYNAEKETYLTLGGFFHIPRNVMKAMKYGGNPYKVSSTHIIGGHEFYLEGCDRSRPKVLREIERFYNGFIKEPYKPGEYPTIERKDDILFVGDVLVSLKNLPQDERGRITSRFRLAHLYFNYGVCTNSDMINNKKVRDLYNHFVHGKRLVINEMGPGKYHALGEVKIEFHDEPYEQKFRSSPSAIIIPRNMPKSDNKVDVTTQWGKAEEPVGDPLTVYGAVKVEDQYYAVAKYASASEPHLIKATGICTKPSAKVEIR